jgi:hypothetical protein
MSIMPECQSIQDQITPVNRDIERTLQQLETADPGQRPTILQQFRGLTERLHALQNSLADCVASSLIALFNGTLTLKIAGQQGRSDISMRILLNNARTVIALTSFPTITSTIGGQTVTVTLTSGGSGTYTSGRISLPLGLHLAASGSLGNSDLSLTLKTDPPGSPVTPEPFGAVILAGSGILQGGSLGGQICELTVAGRISQIASVEAGSSENYTGQSAQRDRCS